jgi:hypothetical protein
MKFKTIFNSALILGLSLILTNCGPESPFIEPEPEELPPITTEGLNTAGCLVNGELWLPKPGGGLKPGIDCEYYPRIEGIDPRIWGGGLINLKKYDNIEGNTGIDLFFKDIYDTGIIPLILNDTTTNRNNKGGGTYRSSIYYNSTVNDSNSLTILKLDTVNNIISGTFQFDAINEEDDTDTIKIREGRFDVKFTY